MSTALMTEQQPSLSSAYPRRRRQTGLLTDELKDLICAIPPGEMTLTEIGSLAGLSRETVRQVRAERNMKANPRGPASRVSAETRETIRSIPRTEASNADLADKFGLSISTVQGIRAGVGGPSKARADLLTNDEKAAVLRTPAIVPDRAIADYFGVSVMVICRLRKQIPNRFGGGPRAALTIVEASERFGYNLIRRPMTLPDIYVDLIERSIRGETFPSEV